MGDGGWGQARCAPFPGLYLGGEGSWVWGLRSEVLFPPSVARDAFVAKVETSQAAIQVQPRPVRLYTCSQVFSDRVYSRLQAFTTHTLFQNSLHSDTLDETMVNRSLSERETGEVGIVEMALITSKWGAPG